MKTIILIPIALLMTSCITPQQSSYNPYATFQPSPSYTPQKTTYHVEPSQSYGSQGYDITVTEKR